MRSRLLSMTRITHALMLYLTAAHTILALELSTSTSTTRRPLTLDLPHARSLILEPILGTNVEYRATDNYLENEKSQIAARHLDSVRQSESIGTSTASKNDAGPMRTKFNANASVHILKASPDCHAATATTGGPDFSPQRAIEAAEYHSTIDGTASPWSTGRHHLYPTTDQPARSLPLDMGSASIQLATNVILPSMAYAFGVDVERLYFKDMFLAKYEAPVEGESGGQAGLGRHTDGSEFSFNMLLSDPIDFEGGGTWVEGVGIVRPNCGEVLMHRGSLLHEGCVVTSGTRYVLVGFVQCDDDAASLRRLKNSKDMKSQLFLKTVESFPMGMVVEVDEGDGMKCATIGHVSENGEASKAGIRQGDCARGIILPTTGSATHNDGSGDLLGFDGKSFDEVMEMLVARKGFGPVQIVIERWSE